MKIAATITKTIQTGIDEYKDIFLTKIFSVETTIAEIIEWARKESRCETFELGAITISKCVE